ncbi:MAG: peptide ABC transporter substrate-binding protein [Chlamydiota bacterium]
MKGIYRLCLLLTAIAWIVTGCKSHSDKPKTSGGKRADRTETIAQTISVNITNEPNTLDPRRMRALNDINLSKMFFEGLTRIDKNNEPSLALAEKIDVSSDFKTYTIKLRKSYWSNQTPVTAHDFIYAWKSSLSPEFSSPNAHMLYIIKNAAEIKAGKLPQSLLGAQALDDYSLKIELINPIPYFLDLISHPIFLPINAKVDRIHPDWATQSGSFVCNGPFLLQNWEHHHCMEVAKNMSYWDNKAVKLKTINLVMLSAETGLELFEDNQLNWNGSPFSVIPTDACATLKHRRRLKKISNLATHLIRINTKSFPLESQKMRRALALAVNRQALVEHITQGNQIAATGIVPMAMDLVSEPYFKDGDIAQAVELFRQALQENEIDHESFPTIKLLYSASDNTRRLLAQALQDQWKQAFSILVELEAVDTQILFDRVAKGDYELAIGSWYADFNDPINFLEIFKSKSVGTNNTNWENTDYQKLLEDSYFCHQKEERKELLRQSEKILIDAMPVIPLYNATMLYVKDDNLENVVLTPMGVIDFKWAYLTLLPKDAHLADL